MGMDLLVEAAEQVSISLVSFSRIDTEVLEFCEAHSALILFRAGDTSCSYSIIDLSDQIVLCRWFGTLGAVTRKTSLAAGTTGMVRDVTIMS